MLPCLPDSVFLRLSSASFYPEIDKKIVTGSSRVGCVFTIYMLPCLPDSVFLRLSSASFYPEIDKKIITGSSRVGMQTSP